MTKSKLFSKCAIMFATTLMLCSCSSTGDRAAKEVINAAKRGDAEKTKELLIKYGDTLQGQDLIDFYEKLEAVGII